MRAISKDIYLSPARDGLGRLFARTQPTPAYVLIALVAAVALPLVFNPWGHNAFELPKAILLRSLGLLALLAALGQVFTGKRYPGGRAILPSPPLLRPTLAFGTALILATLTSVDRHLSLWGSYERQQGLLTQLALLVLFLVTANSLRSPNQAGGLWRALVWGSAIPVLYGLAQALGLDPLDWSTDAASPVLSTLGRSNFFGAYLVQVLPLALGLALISPRRWPYFILISGQVLCLALTKGRGAWLGFSVAALAFAWMWGVVFRDRRPVMMALTTTGLVVGILFLAKGPSGSPESLRDLPVISDLISLTDTSSGSPAARLTIWSASWPLFANRPWLGYGPDTMRLVFTPIFPPQLVYYLGRHVSVDRAHNLWLDLAMATGLLGVVGFAAILIAFGRLVWRNLSQGSDRWTKIGWIAITSAILGHLLDLQVSFDNLATATVFWLTSALAVGLWRAQTSREGEGDRPLSQSYSLSKSLTPFGLLTIVFGAGIGLGILSLRPWLADILYAKSHDQNQPLVEQRLAGAQAVGMWPIEPEYRLRLAWLEGQFGDFLAAEEQFTLADRLRPHDPRIWAAWGEMYVQWSQIEPTRLLQAEAAYRRAIQLAPNLATYHTALGLVLALQGRTEEGVLEVERALQLDATDWIAYRHLANLYIALGRQEDALQAQRLADYWANKTTGE